MLDVVAGKEKVVVVAGVGGTVDVASCLVVEAVAGLLIEFLVDAVVCQAAVVVVVQVAEAASLVHLAACSDCLEVTLIPCLATHQAQETLAWAGRPCCPLTPCLTGQEKEQVAADQAVVSWS